MYGASKILNFEDERIKRGICYVNQLPRDILKITRCSDEVDDFFRSLGANEEATSRYARKFRIQLRLLAAYWKQCPDAPGFKHLRHLEVPLYRFEVRGKELNLRVLFAFVEFEDGEKAVLLHAFYERNDSAKESYKAAIPTALRRLEELKE